MSAIRTATPRLINDSSCSRSWGTLVTSMCSGTVTTACWFSQRTGNTGPIDQILSDGHRKVRRVYVDQQNERAPVPTGPRSPRTVTQIPGASGVTNATIQAVTCYRLSPDPISRSKDMSIPAVAAERVLTINLNQPGTL